VIGRFRGRLLHQFRPVLSLHSSNSEIRDEIPVKKGGGDGINRGVWCRFRRVKRRRRRLAKQRASA